MAEISVIRCQVVPQAKGYNITELAYSSDGKTKGIKIFPFKEQAAVAKAFEGAQSGDVYSVNFQKNDKGYWEFAPTPTKLDKKADMSEVAKPAAKSNWETTEERARRQVMIVRQSSLSNAVALLSAIEPKGVTSSFEDLIDITRRMEEFVLSQPAGDIE